MIINISIETDLISIYEIAIYDLENINIMNFLKLQTYEWIK